MQGVKEALKNHAEFAKETIKTSSKTKPLELAVREIESEKVQLQICSQLIKSGADVNEKGDEITALKGTVSRIPFENYNEKMDMLNRLLESGAKPDSDIVSFLLNNDNSNWGMQYYFTLQILKKLEKYDGKPCDVWEFILAFGDKKSFKTLESLGHQPTKEEIYDTYQNYGKEQYEQGVKVKEDEVRQYSYDANGNQTDVKNTKTGQTESYTYDAENRLSKVSVTDKDGKTAVIQQNRYNGDGQRIQKVEGSKTTNYYYQDGVVFYTTDGDNSQTSQNLIGTDGNILATQRYGSDHTDYLLYHKDIQGSTTSLVKEDGSADATYRYTDFGETTINGDNKAENEVCYTGEIYDQSTGLYYLNARYYNPEDGRFVTEDSYRGEIDDPDTWHLYVYCSNDPIGYVDPSGHTYVREKLWGRYWYDSSNSIKFGVLGSIEYAKQKKDKHLKAYKSAIRKERQYSIKAQRHLSWAAMKLAEDFSVAAVTNKIMGVITELNKAAGKVIPSYIIDKIKDFLVNTLKKKKKSQIKGGIVSNIKKGFSAMKAGGEQHKKVNSEYGKIKRKRRTHF